jgi:3-dehydro-L-gulonate 2-dehydrogenase
MKDQNDTILVSAKDMQMCFEKILEKEGFTKERSKQLAEVFTQNSVDGVYSHGVNRFPRFIENVRKGFVKKDATPSLKNKFNGIEQWNGNLGPGILNAIFATDQCMKLAAENGIGCVALSNTNHWMRGGHYGWQAANKGYVFIGWTNTIANMPAWGAKDARLGNNPLVIGLPFDNSAIVLDMAMSQYSFGKLELMAMKNAKLPVTGGFDKDGKMTNDPAVILESKRPMPIGYWKGTGLSLLLDILAAILSVGLATHEISKREIEYGLSQVFIAIDISKLSNHSVIAEMIDKIITDYKGSQPQDDKTSIIFPGETVLITRQQNLKNGISVMKKFWDEILELQ